MECPKHAGTELIPVMATLMCKTCGASSQKVAYYACPNRACTMTYLTTPGKDGKPVLRVVK